MIQIPFKDKNKDSQWHRDYYQRNKKRLNKRYVERRKLRRKAKKDYIFSILGSKCSQCGYDKCIWALEVHCPDHHDECFSHLSWKRIKELLPISQMLCSNCHREVEYELHN